MSAIRLLPLPPVLTLSWGPGPADPQPSGVSVGQQTQSCTLMPRPPQPSHSWATARAQVKVSQEGASLYYLSALLGTWPLSSQPGMEPVPH